MKPRRVIDCDVTPSGEPIELAFEAGHYIVRVNGAPLMSSAMHHSEELMAEIAADWLGDRKQLRVLVGGLGLGFTLRAALDRFGADARITVAELLPAMVRFNRGELGALTNRPLEDTRVTLLQDDVRVAFHKTKWHAILLDIDNGPEEFTVPGNSDLYGAIGIAEMAAALRPDGVLVVWSAFPSPAFEKNVSKLGLSIETRQVRARPTGKGPRHTLFIIS